MRLIKHGFRGKSLKKGVVGVNFAFPRAGWKTRNKFSALSLLKGTITQRRFIMLGWSITFLILALVAGVLGFTGIAGTAAGIAQILFIVFLVLTVLSFVMRALKGRSVV